MVAAPPTLRGQPYAKRPQSLETSIYKASVDSKEKELTLRLQSEQEEYIVRPLGRGLFFKYYLVVLVKL